eukprot:195356-Pyramimonas_sp.AAC.1
MVFGALPGPIHNSPRAELMRAPGIPRALDGRMPIYGLGSGTKSMITAALESPPGFTCSWPPEGRPDQCEGQQMG